MSNETNNSGVPYRSSAASPEPSPKACSVPFRIGQGVDVHAFGEGDHVVLGGVVIPHEKGLIAHSDGDVLLHALCDALLGAVGLGDIGRHFPDTDAQFAGADSQELLRHVYQLVVHSGYEVMNADMTVIAQAPKMAPHLETINQNVARVLHCHTAQINTKATTSEKLGFTGRKEGITALAVVMLQRHVPV